MREEDKLMTEQGQVLEKKPYNLRERKIKDAPYRNMIRAELADELYDRIMNIIVLRKKYKDPNYSAKDLAKDALHMLIDKRYAEKNVEEISTMVGFANRQSFYAAFYKNVGETPNNYRRRKLENNR